MNMGRWYLYIFVHMHTYMCMYVTEIIREKEAITLRGLKEGSWAMGREKREGEVR